MISIREHVMHGSARWGQVLKVELAYLSSNHFFILGIFSGRVEGRSGTDVLCGQVHDAPSLGLAHQLLMDSTYLSMTQGGLEGGNGYVFEGTPLLSGSVCRVSVGPPLCHRRCKTQKH